MAIIVQVTNFAPNVTLTIFYFFEIIFLNEDCTSLFYLPKKHLLLYYDREKFVNFNKEYFLF